MTQVTVNEASIDDTPIVFQFRKAMRRHDLAERTNHEADMAAASDHIRGIEDAASGRWPGNNLPDILFRICVARARMGKLYGDYLSGSNPEPTLQEVEDLLDMAMASLRHISGCDHKAWRLDYYTCGDVSQKQAAA